MRILETTLPGVLRIIPVVHGDARGFFMETFRENALQEAGIHAHFVQDNMSRSMRGTLRGLHFQHPHNQGKLVRVTRGSVFDVAVDIRRGSPHFGSWYGCMLDEENREQLWIPPGFAHGFLVMSDTADFVYKCTEYHHPECEGAVAWNDPDIGITWPLDGVPLLSLRDANAPVLLEQKTLPVYASLDISHG